MEAILEDFTGVGKYLKRSASPLSAALSPVNPDASRGSSPNTAASYSPAPGIATVDMEAVAQLTEKERFYVELEERVKNERRKALDDILRDPEARDTETRVQHEKKYVQSYGV